jgi:hypothetical protein
MNHTHTFIDPIDDLELGDLYQICVVCLEVTGKSN